MASKKKEIDVNLLEFYRDRHVVSMVMPPFCVSFSLVGQEILRHIHGTVVPSRLVLHLYSSSGYGGNAHVLS